MAVPVESVVAETASRLETLETDLLLEAIYQLYGDDFRGYEREPLRERLAVFMKTADVSTLSGLQEKVIHTPGVGQDLLRALLTRPAALFDPAARYDLLRQSVGPLLRSYAAPKVWLAECASAEEVYSLAILLEEEGLYDKTLLYATSPNERLLESAREGVFPSTQWASYEANYRQAGGKRELSDYCIRTEDGVVFVPQLRRNIIWSQFSLATDMSFNEFQLIVCRQPMNEFGPALRRRALALFSESLSPFGVLSVEAALELEVAPFSINYQNLGAQAGLYRRTAW